MPKSNFFFGMQTCAPWPETYPKGRCIQEKYRHATLVFLPATSLDTLKPYLVQLPLPSFHIGPSGVFNSCFLINAQTLVLGMKLWDQQLYEYQKKLQHWIEEKGFKTEKRKWLPHLTICRKPGNAQEWIDSFYPLPFYIEALHLYESLGHSEYKIHDTHSFSPPFYALEHMADLAFTVYGTTYLELFIHALTALAFEYPPMILYEQPFQTYSSIEEVIISLNDHLHEIDTAFGCPFKAVSFHGNVQNLENNLLKWEMIIDV